MSTGSTLLFDLAVNARIGLDHGLEEIVSDHPQDASPPSDSAQRRGAPFRNIGWSPQTRLASHRLQECHFLDAHASLLSGRLEQALRFAAAGHRDQLRRTSGVPYVEHVVAVAWILDRAGFEEDVVVAGLLHDLVEDTTITSADIEGQFGRIVAELVTHCSEVKADAQGRKRPWLDRKTDHIAALIDAPVGARAIVLADKLHNLLSIELDLRQGLPVWAEFHAERQQVLWYYRSIIASCTSVGSDSRLQQIAVSCRELLHKIEAFSS